MWIGIELLCCRETSIIRINYDDTNGYLDVNPGEVSGRGLVSGEREMFKSGRRHRGRRLNP